MKQQQKDGWFQLCQLQRQLKKQFLLVEKEQQEKIKLKRQIEESIRSYHSLCIQTHFPHGELLKEEGFQNCYNFVKDVILAISLNIQVGRVILYESEERSAIPNLIINGFYENVQTNDPFSKEITRLIHLLLSDYFNKEPSDNEQQKILQAWQMYLQKIDHSNYFQQIADGTLKQLMKGNQDKRKKSIHHQNNQQNNQKQEDGINAYQLQIKTQEQLIKQFMEKILNQSELCPPSIKIPLRSIIQQGSIKSLSSNKIFIAKLWHICSYFFMKPFIAVASNQALPNLIKEKILHFANELISKWKFTANLTKCSQQKRQKIIESLSQNFQIIQKICCNLVTLNEQRYNSCIINSIPQEQLTIQIRIYGAYLNLTQLHQLLILIHTHKQAFSKINEKVVSRTLKIFQISPKLQILHRDKPSLLFVSLAELRYEESISSDYYKNYTVVYRTETHKQMLKQVLVQIPNLQDFRTENKKTFREIFQGIVNRNQSIKTGSNLSAQLEMKVKYLIYLLGKNNNANWQFSIIQQMKTDLEQRDQQNMKLFQDTKFSLLKVYCNLRNLKIQLKNYCQSQRKCIVKMNLINQIQLFKIDLCLTSKASRNNEVVGEESLDKYRYRISSADQILVQSITQCIHRENAFTGRQSHAPNVVKFLHIFANLAEVKHILSQPSFLKNVEKDCHLYNYCNQAKIGQAFHSFVKQLQQKLNLQNEQKHMLETVLYRYLCELLLGKKQNLTIGIKDRQLLDKIQSFTTDNIKQAESPRKDSQRKRRGSHHDSDSKKWIPPQVQMGQNKIHIDQLMQMGSRYIATINQVSLPLDKMRKLKQIIDIYRIVLGKNDSSITATMDQLLINTIIKAKPINFISNLGYLEMFLPEEKLMSSEGKVLKQFQKLISGLVSGQFDSYFALNFQKTISHRQKTRLALEC